MNRGQVSELAEGFLLQRWFHIEATLLPILEYEQERVVLLGCDTDNMQWRFHKDHSTLDGLESAISVRSGDCETADRPVAWRRIEGMGPQMVWRCL